MAHLHGVVVRRLLGAEAEACREYVVPVLHVVGLGDARGATVAHHIVPLSILHVLGGVLVHLVEPPGLHHADPVGVPGQNAPVIDDDVGKDREMAATEAVARKVLVGVLLGFALAGLSVVLVHAGLDPGIAVSSHAS